MHEPIKVLFICTANACRSQMAEAVLRDLDSDRFESLSAGAHPVGFIHALATGAMSALGVAMVDHRSKSWDEFANAPVDVVVTLCDAVIQEGCPVWPGDAIVVHWATPDPVGLAGTDEQREEFALAVARRLQSKIRGLVAIDFARSSRDELRRLLEEAGGA